jgi:hypothetical protein
LKSPENIDDILENRERSRVYYVNVSSIYIQWIGAKVAMEDYVLEVAAFSQKGFEA